CSFIVGWLTTSTEAGVCNTGNPSLLALPATAPVLSGVVGAVVAAGAVGAGVVGAAGVRVVRRVPGRVLGGGEVTVTRGSSVLWLGCAVSAALGVAASSASGNSVNDERE